MIRKAIIVVLTLGAVGTGVAWIVSFTSSVGYFRNAKGVTLHGGFLVAETFSTYPWQSPQGWYVTSFAKQGHPHACECTLAGWLPYQTFRRGQLVSVGVPCWVLLVLLGGYPAIALIRGPLRRWRRCRKGLCPDCGYNLTGNESGVCPECGKPI